MMENDLKKIFILIPAYNEENSITKVVTSLKENDYHRILVVNDGSKDHTAQKAKDAGAEVLNLVINRGQGAALKAGIEYLKENHDPDIIVTFDADGQHQVEEIKDIIAPILEEKYDITLGSRFLNGKTKIHWTRRLVLKAGIFFTWFISNIKLTDTHNGFRGLGKKAITSIEITQRGMEHASEILDNLKKKNLKYKEVPVTIVYTEYSNAKGQKTSNFIKLGFKILIRKITK